MAGSGKKPFRQKGTGQARQGNKRAPGRKGGAKAHGAKIRSLRTQLPKKVRLVALKSMLSAKLAEGKLIVVKSDKIPEIKTKHVAKALDHYGEQKETFLFVSEYKFDDKLPKATGAFKRFQWCSADV